MERLKWLSIPVAAVYVVLGAWVFLSGLDEGSSSGQDLFEGLFGILFWLALSLGCIWYGEELGEGLVGARFGLISSVSPGWAVQLMGWVFLLLPVALALWVW
ncbi:MAG TPA: hypothetical protein PLU87_02300 [Sedimentisphaerales bacterium]|nr:hypothetical protein [Sedimentisphaerales bacterium]HRS09787.1 hypothetical protein [Sedimentisphaerales bacterium]HRV46563.1 hypothetical protein [Sedimentisphaerales bacterium]